MLSNKTGLLVKERAKVATSIRWVNSFLVLTLLMPFTQFVNAEGLEEVVVTAQRRSENLQDVPIAISALTADTIEKEDIHDLTDIATRVPGLTFSPFSAGQNIVSLRGVSSNDDGAGTDNSAAVYIDGVYAGRVSNINPEMFDLAGIEVLRGPQGTLYGKNTIGGAILVRTKRPNTEELDMKFKVNTGNYSRHDFSGLITGPLSENWAGKISFSSRNRDGWVDNVVLDKDQKDDNSQNVRGQFLFTGEKLEVLFSGDYHVLDVEDMGRIPLTQRVGALGPIVDAYHALCGVDSGPDCSTNPFDGFAKREALGGSMHVTYDLGFAELTSITAARKTDIHWIMDSVGTTAFPPLGDDIKDKTDQFSQEFRLSGDTEYLQGKYIVGLWYLNEQTDRRELFDVVIPGTIDSEYRQDNETDSYAIFGQYDWDITDQWSLGVGGRYSYEQKDIENSAIGGTNIPIIGATFANTAEADWQSFTPKIVLGYRPTDEISTYLSASKGFKSGGFAAAPVTILDTQPLEQEEAINYEFGVKADLFDNTLRLNTAIFRTYYKNVQYQSFGPRPNVAEFGIFRTANLRRARAQGVEVEYLWLPTDNFTLSGSYGYLRAKYRDANLVNSAFGSQSGQDMVRAPRHKYSINGEYVFNQLGNLPGSLAVAANYRYTGDQRGELEPYAIQPSHGIADARLTWTSPGEQYEISAWIKNLADEEYITHVYTIGAEVLGVFGDPRMYGVSLTYDY